MKTVLSLFVLTLLSCSTLPMADAPIGPTVLLISIDGFRADYLKKYPTPYLAQFVKEGMKAEWLAPIFPTATFPNHYTIATGMTAEEHGIVGNDMYDPRTKRRFSLKDPKALDAAEWWGGEPIWVTAEKQGVLTGTVFWVGSNAEIQGVRPRYYRVYDGTVTAEARVRQVFEWLDKPTAERPRFLTLYFEDVDSAGHRFGPNSNEVRAAIERVDGAIGLLRAELKKRGWERKINCLFVSDHGMTEVHPKQFISLAKLIDREPVEISGYGAFANIFVPPARLQTVKHKLARPGLHVFEKHEVPARLHYRNHPRIGDLVVIADAGWYLVPPGGKQSAADTRGAHGYDPLVADMHGIFFASGPDFTPGSDSGAVANTSLYALMVRLLGLKPSGRDIVSVPATD